MQLEHPISQGAAAGAQVRVWGYAFLTSAAKSVANTGTTLDTARVPGVSEGLVTTEGGRGRAVRLGATRLFTAAAASARAPGPVIGGAVGAMSVVAEQTALEMGASRAGAVVAAAGAAVATGGLTAGAVALGAAFSSPPPQSR